MHQVVVGLQSRITNKRTTMSDTTAQVKSSKINVTWFIVLALTLIIVFLVTPHLQKKLGSGSTTTTNNQ